MKVEEFGVHKYGFRLYQSYFPNNLSGLSEIHQSLEDAWDYIDKILQLINDGINEEDEILQLIILDRLK